MNSSHPHASTVHHPPPKLQQGIDIFFVLNAAQRWWKLAIPCGLLLAGVSGALIHATFVPEYRAAALLRISSDTPYIVFHSSGNSSTFIRNQVELIRSRLVLGAVLDQPEIARMPELNQTQDRIAALAKRIKVSSIGNSDLFQIAYTGLDPKDAAAVANAITDSYFELRGDYEAKRIQRVIQILKEESEGRESEVTSLRENVRELAKKLKVRDPLSTGSSTVVIRQQQHPLDNLGSHISTSEVELAVLEAQTQAYREWMAAQPIVASEAVIERTIDQHPESQKLKAQIARNQALLSEYEAVGNETNMTATFRQLRREIERDENTLKQMRENLKLEIKEQLESDLKTRRQDELQQMGNRSESLAMTVEVLKKRLEEQLKSEKESSGETIVDTIELKFKQAELTRAEEVLNLIDRRTLQLRTERRAPERVESLAIATAPISPVEALPYKQLLLAAAFCLCAPFGLAVAWEYRVLRVNDAAQLERIPHLNVLGEIANLPVRKGNGLRNRDRVSRGLSLFEESIDSLRTGLVLGEPVEDMQVLAVTSASTQEGKTSVAIQLAMSLSQATGEKTLLIDGDMRVPDIHEVFEVPIEPGLSKLLDHQCTLDEAIVTSWGELHLIPAGKLHVSPHKLLGNGALKSVLDEARQRYRYIVIDTPPMLAAGEALMLAKGADVSLLCAMCDVSRIRRVRSVFNRLSTAGANPRGVVLSGVPTHSYTHAYGYYGYEKS